jgi:hypothetical protein
VEGGGTGSANWRCWWKRSCYIKYANCKLFRNYNTGSPTESDDGTTKVLQFKDQGVTQHNGKFRKNRFKWKSYRSSFSNNEVLHDANGVEQEVNGIDF